MAADVRVRGVRAGDVAAIAGAMRAPDADECASAGFSARDGLQLSVEASTASWVVEIDGEPAAIFGLGRASGARSAPWMLATDRLVSEPMAVARRARRIVAAWARDGAMENWCDAQNVVALRFLEWLGFTVEPTEGRRLVRFSMPQAVR